MTTRTARMTGMRQARPPTSFAQRRNQQTALERRIHEAIIGKTRLYMEYSPGLRLIEPHAYGFSRAGDLLLYAYQVRGASQSGGIPDWRTFRIDRIARLFLDLETFPVRDDYDPRKLKIYEVITKVRRDWQRGAAP